MNRDFIGIPDWKNAIPAPVCEDVPEYEPHTIWECYAPDSAMPATIAESMDLVRRDFCGWSALGPISVYIEDVIGFHTVNAFEGLVEWQKPAEFKKLLGIKNLRFGEVVTDILAEGDCCRVKSNRPYTLKINGKAFPVEEGEQTFVLS